tara:strand:- start:26751 stop:27665 length:915 start_codon:yes stop_codon:yes gene_type:complete
LLGILLGIDTGLIQLIPGEDPVQVIEGPCFEIIDYQNQIAIGAAKEAGVWVYKNESWSQCWEGNPSSARIGPDGTLWVGTFDTRLYFSNDQGNTWNEMSGLQNVIKHRQISTPPNHKMPYITGVIFPKQGEIIGIAGGGAWHTRDKGENWLQRSDGLDKILYKIQEHPENSDILFASTESGFYKSDDSGFSWMHPNMGIGERSCTDFEVFPSKPDALLLVNQEQTDENFYSIYRSPNGGVTWTKINLGNNNIWERRPVITRLWNTSDTGFASVDGNIWASHDSGKNWISLATGLPKTYAITAAL